MDFTPKRAENPDQKDDGSQKLNGDNFDIANKAVKIEGPFAAWGPQIEGLRHTILYSPGE
jgi:hypothetical protein